MDQAESGVHSFVIRIWIEENAGKGRRATWRGHVTHVPGGERKYFEGLDAIPLFIASYLERSGARLGVHWRMKKWKASVFEQARRWRAR
jgi:hypothetical protein